MPPRNERSGLRGNTRERTQRAARIIPGAAPINAINEMQRQAQSRANRQPNAASTDVERRRIEALRRRRAARAAAQSAQRGQQ